MHITLLCDDDMLLVAVLVGEYVAGYMQGLFGKGSWLWFRRGCSVSGKSSFINFSSQDLTL